MGKHRHSKDKMHITYTELQDRWDQFRQNKGAPFSRLPFNYCALSLSPFENPVCTIQGNVFDIVYVMPFIRKYHRCPITGMPLKASQLVKMNWSVNQNEQFQDPVSYKVFTEHTHIVCIKTSGNVYAYETVIELNKRPKHYFDLLTNEPFTVNDIIHVQNSQDNKDKDIQGFHYMQNPLPFEPMENMEPSIQCTQSFDRIKREMEQQRRQKSLVAEEDSKAKKRVKEELQTKEDVKSFIEWSISNSVYRHHVETDSTGSASTSTRVEPSFIQGNSYRVLKPAQVRAKIYKEVKAKKMKALAQISTNLGNMNVLLHADLVPRTVENFVELAESGYYDGGSFHRLVRDFCLQGGDPIGTGTGGESIFGHAFEDEFQKTLSHSKRGIVSMANSGPNTNKSQFFILLAPSPTLDNKHTVFGEIISNDELLVSINNTLSSKSNRPKVPIDIIKIFVYDNCFRKVIKNMRDEHFREAKRLMDPQAVANQHWVTDPNQKFTIIPANHLEPKKDSLAAKVLKDYY